MSRVGALLAAGIVSAAVLSVEGASATPPPVALSALPTGHMPEPPTKEKLPTSIAPGEKVPGFYATKRARRAFPHGKLPPGYPIPVMITTSKEETESPTADPRSATSSDVCMNDGFNVRTVSRPDEAEQSVWTARLLPTVMVHTRGRASDKRLETEVIHAERLVRNGEQVALEVTDLAFDPNTLGMRLIDRATLPLGLVAHGPFGSDIYAVRDGTLVHFVASPPTVGAPFPAPPVWQEVAIAEPDGSVVNAEGCQHTRITLSAQVVGAQTAMLQGAITFPRPADPPKEETDDQEKPSDTPEQGRARTLRSYLTVSRSSADPEPVVSVSFGWFGKERKATIF
jgi:hypothetical protein